MEEEFLAIFYPESYGEEKTQEEKAINIEKY